MPVASQPGRTSPRAPGPRIVVTGVGLVTPHGCGAETSWQGLLAGRRATRRLEESMLHPPGWPDRHRAAWEAAGWCGAPAPGAFLPDVDPVATLARLAAREAWNQAGLSQDTPDPERIGCVVGTSKGGVRLFADLFRQQRETTSAMQDSAPDWRGVWPDAAVRAVAEELGTAGPQLCPVAACATGVTSLIRGAALLRDGLCDVVVAGSSDASLQPAVLASFRRLGVLADSRGDPARACRPFDRSRSGLVIGEGAAILILERREQALRRRATILAEWLGGIELGDATGLTAVDPSGEPLQQLIGRLLSRCGVPAEDIQAVSAHGTGTRFNDEAEGNALARLFGTAASGPAVFGLKGGIGHLLGAAGSVESAACVLALRDQIVPPTVNLEDPDVPIQLTRSTARRLPLRHVLKLSLGFGGHLAACLFRHPSVGSND